MKLLPLLALILALAPTFASAANDEGTCESFGGSPIGTIIATCNTVLEGKSADSLFEVQSGHFCFSQDQKVLNLGPAIETYVGIDWAGRYVGAYPSSDHLLPSGRNDPGFAPGEAADYGMSTLFFSHPDGTSEPRYGAGATIEHGNLHADGTIQDGLDLYYFNFRTQIDYDASAKTLTVQYSRQSGGFFGIGATWQKLYSVKMGCN